MGREEVNFNTRQLEGTRTDQHSYYSVCVCVCDVNNWTSRIKKFSRFEICFNH